VCVAAAGGGSLGASSPASEMTTKLCSRLVDQFKRLEEVVETVSGEQQTLTERTRQSAQALRTLQVCCNIKHTLQYTLQHILQHILQRTHCSTYCNAHTAAHTATHGAHAPDRVRVADPAGVCRIKRDLSASKVLCKRDLSASKMYAKEAYISKDPCQRGARCRASSNCTSLHRVICEFVIHICSGSH